jgi:hypothetical protein
MIRSFICNCSNSKYPILNSGLISHVFAEQVQPATGSRIYHTAAAAAARSRRRPAPRRRIRTTPRCSCCYPPTRARSAKLCRISTAPGFNRSDFGIQRLVPRPIAFSSEPRRSGSTRSAAPRGATHTALQGRTAQRHQPQAQPPGAATGSAGVSSLRDTEPEPDADAK